LWNVGLGAAIVPGATPHAPPTITAIVFDLLATTKVRADVMGSGIQSVRPRKPFPDPPEVLLPAGLHCVTGRSSAQNAVGTSSRSVVLTDNEWTSISVQAACANQPQDIPTTGDRLTVRRSPARRAPDQALPAPEQMSASYSVAQAAIWIPADAASFGGDGTLIRRPASQSHCGTSATTDQATAARALRIMAGAGVDVAHRVIGAGSPAHRGWYRRSDFGGTAP